RLEGNGYGNVRAAAPFLIDWLKMATSLAWTPQAALISEPNGPSMNLPTPPRTTVFPFANARQAKPKRGAKSVFCEYRRLSGMPACLAVRIGVGAIEPANAGFKIFIDSSLGITTAPCTVTPLMVET